MSRAVREKALLEVRLVYGGGFRVKTPSASSRVALATRIRSSLAAPMPCMKISCGRSAGEQVARAPRAACFGLSSKKGKKRGASSASSDVPDAENPEAIEDAVPDPPAPPPPPGSLSTQQDRELKALAESIKRMYADYVNDFVKEVSYGNNEEDFLFFRVFPSRSSRSRVARDETAFERTVRTSASTSMDYLPILSS
jgi:hypothetical protein